MTSVFLPCIPNPTTGFYFFVPTKDIIELPMSPDDAAKLIMSAGPHPAGRAGDSRGAGAGRAPAARRGRGGSRRGRASGP